MATTNLDDHAVVPVGAPGATSSTINWNAIVLAVLIGMGITFLLVTVGAAAGAMVEDGDVAKGDEGKIAAALGSWTVIAALGGAFVGSYIGGRYTRWVSIGSAMYHAMGAWALSLVLSIWLGTNGASGLLGSAFGSAANQPRADIAKSSGTNAKDILDAVGWSGWALAGGLILTLIVSVTAWRMGAHRSLDGFEKKPA
ncbi:MAG: hypothetical protein JWM98_2189 [Thermoleophilia bacterium]|nr:hypothetical protein [Thermoleophilia bacterium]